MTLRSIDVEGPRCGRDVKGAARDLGAYVCFEDEAGQGLRPPKGRTWAPRGSPPAGEGARRGPAGSASPGWSCYRPGDRPHFYYQLLVYRRRKGEPQGIQLGRTTGT